MYISRDIDTALNEWKDSNNRKPLLLRGVRQCGKTSAVRHLAEQFVSYVELNFDKKPSLYRIFEGDLDINTIISRIEIEMSVFVNDGETLLFIDEIQACPRAISALRYFYEDRPGLHVIAAGSLLEFVFGKKDGEEFDFPVGRVRSLFMYPFSFREFLKGIGNEQLLNYLDRFDVNSGSNDFHGKLIDLYKTFLVVGGMPEAVKEYVSSKSFLKCQDIHRDIILSMIDDFEKYHSKVPADMIRKVFDFAMHNICSQTKASSAVTGVSAYYFDECVDLLRRAGLLYPVWASSCDKLPLGAMSKQANKKLLVFDTGIYLTECKLDAAGILSAEVFDDMNKGDVVEMETGLEMIKYSEAYREAALFYWYRTGANAEVDYVLEKKGQIIPVEVKASGKGSMQSMNSFMKTHENIPYGIRVSMEDFVSYDNIKVFPVYAVSKIIGDRGRFSVST